MMQSYNKIWMPLTYATLLFDVVYVARKTFYVPVEYVLSRQLLYPESERRHLERMCTADWSPLFYSYVFRIAVSSILNSYLRDRAA